MINFTQIRTFFKLIIEYPSLAPYVESTLEFFNQSANLANDIKEPIYELFNGNIDSSNSIKTAISFFFAIILLFLTKFPSFFLSVLQLFICIFNLILKFLEFFFKLLIFVFEKKKYLLRFCAYLLSSH